MVFYTNYYMYIGSRAAFHRVYEQPIVNGKEPSATAEEKEIAARRADEVILNSPSLHLDHRWTLVYLSDWSYRLFACFL